MSQENNNNNTSSSNISNLIKLTDEERSAIREILKEDQGYSNFVRDLFNVTGNDATDMTHAVLGLVTESYEMACATDGVNMLEEQGDFTFYMEAAIQVAKRQGFNAEEFQSLCQSEDVARLFDGIANCHAQRLEQARNYLLDQVKRWVGYGKRPTSVELMLAVAYVHILPNASLAAGMPHYLFDGVDVVVANVHKLLKRYQGRKFDANLAVNRDVVAERDALEAAAGQ